MGELVNNLGVDEDERTGRGLYRRDLYLHSSIESAVH